MGRRRGRPKQEDGPVITRDELVRLAANAIGREGLDRASMRGIAREAGVSLATVQNHFHTKEDLWKAVVDETVVPNERLSSQEYRDGAALVATLVQHRLGMAFTSPGLAGQVLIDGAAEGERLLTYLVERTEDLRARHRRRVEEAVEHGALRAVNVDAMMVLLGVALPALSSSKSAVRQLVGPDLDVEEDRSRLADAITDILLYGLLPRPSENPSEG
jgi:AcrR family transcriptional regulator